MPFPFRNSKAALPQGNGGDGLSLHFFPPEDVALMQSIKYALEGLSPPRGIPGRKCLPEF